MGLGPSWSADEVAYLDDRWGSVSIPAIARKLGRSEGAVKQKAKKIGLVRHIHSGEYVTLNQLKLALSVYGGGYTEWIKKLKKNGCPIKYKASVKKKFAIIYMNDFWKWAEKNKKVVNFANFECNALGLEPGWVAVKRKADQVNRLYGYGRLDAWSPWENQQLIKMLNEYRWTYSDIAHRLCRTESAVKRQINKLKLKVWPLIREKHVKWTDEEINIVRSMHEDGYCADAIAAKLPRRSALAVQGKLEAMERGGKAQSDLNKMAKDNGWYELEEENA